MSNLISKVQPLHMQAYNILKKSIIDGEFQSDQRITEVRLAKMFGISRGPVREAIRMLIQDGLLVQQDGPIQVYQPTKEDIIEVFLCRECLEALATRLAAQNMTSKVQEHLLENIEKTKETIKRQDVGDLSRLDQEFHEIIIKASGNKQLIQLAVVIQAKVAYMRNQILSYFHQHFVDTVDEHFRIYRMLIDGEPFKAEQEMRLHISKAVGVFSYLVK